MEAGTRSTGLTRMKTGTGERRLRCGVWREIHFSPISSLLSARPASRFWQAGAPGTPFLPCLQGPTDCPQQLPSPSPPAPGQPAGRTRRGQHTRPTRPEINISRETELVLSVFTAKGQAGLGRGGGGGEGRAEEPHPEPKASSPARPRACCVPLSQPLALSEPTFQTSLGLGLPTASPSLACGFSGCKSLVLDASFRGAFS